jgi:hypothetical protein
MNTPAWQSEFRRELTKVSAYTNQRRDALVEAWSCVLGAIACTVVAVGISIDGKTSDYLRGIIAALAIVGAIACIVGVVLSVKKGKASRRMVNRALSRMEQVAHGIEQPL